jgi:hypothetical protein
MGALAAGFFAAAGGFVLAGFFAVAAAADGFGLDGGGAIEIPSLIMSIERL